MQRNQNDRDTNGAYYRVHPGTHKTGPSTSLSFLDSNFDPKQCFDCFDDTIIFSWYKHYHTPPKPHPNDTSNKKNTCKYSHTNCEYAPNLNHFSQKLFTTGVCESAHAPNKISTVKCILITILYTHITKKLKNRLLKITKNNKKKKKKKKTV